MIYSYSRIVRRAVALGAIALLTACQSGGMALPQGAASATRPAPGSISKNGCFGFTLAIIPHDRTTKPDQKVALYAWVVTHFIGFNHHCMGGLFKHAPMAAWTSNGGHFQPKQGFPVYFAASKVQVYTIQAKDQFRGQTLSAQDMVTVQK
jgi:hypothetical protein